MKLSMWSRVTQLMKEMFWDESILFHKGERKNATLDVCISHTRLLLPESWDIHKIFLTLLFLKCKKGCDLMKRA